MAVDARAIFKELNGYLVAHPDETAALMPLFDSMLDHAQTGLCAHDGRCPVIRAGAVLVNERGLALALRRDGHGAAGGGWGFAEGDPEAADLSLRDTAARVLQESSGVHDLWPAAGTESPVLVDISSAAAGGVSRPRYGFRYLFRVRTGVLLRTLTELGHARWISLDGIGSPLLSARLKDRLGGSV
ncbi:MULTISPECIES: NUDIX domain-containing protein [unclassified Streptomyces]|uniref:NUDIX domain-containing protein n=1 Tax=unclassified Streptomyces TaxID=2593676 RepID=UPI0037F49107